MRDTSWSIGTNGGEWFFKVIVVADIPLEPGYTEGEPEETLLNAPTFFPTISPNIVSIFGEALVVGHFL